MAARVFRIGPSPLAPFLQAAVGREGNGMDMTVLSALARLGKHPWAEAARLADLSPAAVVERLASAILTLCGLGWPMAEATAAARRLVTLLPAHAHPDGLEQPITGSALRDGRRTRVVPVGVSIGAAVVFAVHVGLAPRLSGPFCTKPLAAMPAANTSNVPQ